jgi:acyl dehydratase
MLSCLTGFAKSLDLPDDGVVFRLNYGFDRVRIITPVPVDSRIRGRFHMRSLESRGESAALMTLEAVVEIEGTESPALIADWLAYLQLTPSTSA